MTEAGRPVPPKDLVPRDEEPRPLVPWPSDERPGEVTLPLLPVAVLAVVVASVVALAVFGGAALIRSGALDPHTPTSRQTPTGTHLPTGTRPPIRPLPSPIRDAVVLVPLGDFPSSQADEIAAREATDYGLSISVAPPLAIDPAMIDPARGQLVAERLSRSIAASHPESAGRTLVIGLTTQDIYIAGKPEWRYAFALRDGSGVAVVSSARMTSPIGSGREWDRMRKMVTRDIGFLYYGLPTSTDPTDILYNNILGPDDLDRIGDHL